MESLVSETSTAVTGLPTVQLDARATTRRELDELLQVSASFSSVKIILTIRSLCHPSMVFGFLIPLLILKPYFNQNLWDSDEEGLSFCRALKEGDDSSQRKNFQAVPSLLRAFVPLNF
jgi:hypothetical protein